MALIVNHSRLASSNAGRYIGAASFGALSYNSWSSVAARHLLIDARDGAAEAGVLVGHPAGLYLPAAILLPRGAGKLGTREGEGGSSTDEGALHGAREGSGESAGSSVGFGLATLVAGLVGTSIGSSINSGAINGALFASGTSTGTSVGAGFIGALAGLVGTSVGSSTNAGVATALGFMRGTSTTTEDLSPTALAAAVWSAAASAYSVAGTMGGKLNDAGSAADPWDDPRALTMAKFLGLK